MLRPSFVQSFALYTFPPRGRLEIRLQIFADFCAAKTRQGEGLTKKRHIYRKQVAPLDFQKFLPKYSENQKWAAHSMLRPLIFRNSFRNIQKIKNRLRRSSVAKSDTKPPRLPLGGNSARKARNRKQVAPLIRPKLCFVHLPPEGKA